MRKKLFILLSAATALLATEQFESKGLVGFSDLPENKSYPLAVLVQGAQRESVQRLQESLKGEVISLGFALAAIEKGEETVLQERVEKTLLLLEQSKTLFPGWNGQVALIGQGEGGRVAAKVAAKQKDLVALILLSPGGGWNPKEELLTSFRKELADSGFSPQYIHSFLVQARQQFENAASRPTSDLDCFGFTYKHWDGLLKSDLLGELALLKCPIYYIHGDLDDRIPIESADYLVENLKQNSNFTAKRYSAGRELIRDLATYRDAFDWLQAQLTKETLPRTE